MNQGHALFADAATAERLIGRTRAVYLATAKALRDLDPATGDAFLDLGTTYAVYAGDGSPLTQATGAFESQHLTELDRFFAGRATSWEAILTPFAGPDALQRVLDAKATVMGWENTLFRPLTDLPEHSPPGDVKIVEVEPEQIATWSEVSRRAFFGDQDTEVGLQLSRIMERTPDTRRYLALWQGQPAAAATMMTGERVAFLGGAATMAEFRGRGLQSALLTRRLHDAAREADLATMGAVPGSTSQRNAERLGFRIAYSQLSLRVPTNPPT